MVPVSVLGDHGMPSPLSGGDWIGRLKSNHSGLDTTLGRALGDVVVDGAQNIRVNVVTQGGVDQNLVAVTKRVERVKQAGLVQETHFRAQLDAVQGYPFIFFNVNPNTALNIPAQDEQEARSKTNDDANQQIGVDDRQDRDDKRNELGGTLLPQAAEDLGTGQLEARNNQDRGERRKRDAIQ